MKILFRVIGGFIAAVIFTAFRLDKLFYRIAGSYVCSDNARELFFILVIILSVFGILKYIVGSVLIALFYRASQFGILGLFSDASYYKYAVILGALVGLLVKFVFLDTSEEDDEEDKKKKEEIKKAEEKEKARKAMKKEKRKAEEERIIRMVQEEEDKRCKA